MNSVSGLCLSLVFITFHLLWLNSNRHLSGQSCAMSRFIYSYFWSFSVYIIFINLVASVIRECYEVWKCLYCTIIPFFTLVCYSISILPCSIMINSPSCYPGFLISWYLPLWEGKQSLRGSKESVWLVIKVGESCGDGSCTAKGQDRECGY